MFDPALPERVRHFLERYCVQSKHPWAGKPLKLLPWQWEQLICPLYGNKREDGTLQYKRAGIWIPKKQGKSCLMSGLCLYHLLDQPGSEIYVIASDVAQAGIVFNEAANMVELSPALSKRLWVRRNIKAIEDKKGKSVFRVLSSEPTGKAGFSANFLVYDELAEWPKATAQQVWDQLQNATAARVNALQVVISTAQYDKESLGFREYKYAKGVLTGEIKDDSFLPLIYEVPESADWKNPENWWKANPSAGITVPKQDWVDDFNRVQNQPHDEARFKTLRLNMWVGHVDQWIATDTWAACGEDLNEADFHGCRAYIGLDYARRYDLCAYSVIVERGEVYYLFPRFFIPREIALKKEKLDSVPYVRDWAHNPRNNLYLTEGDVVDPAYMRAKLLEDFERFDVVEIGFDPWGLEESRQTLQAQGLPLVEVTQTPAVMGQGVAHFERLVIGKRLRHPRNPILDWNLSNCCIRSVGGTDCVMLDKRRSTGRIDGITSACIGLTRVLAYQEFYDSPVLFI